MPCRDPARQRLTLKIFDEDRFHTDDALGFSLMPIQALCDGAGHELQLELHGTRASGKVRLSVRYAPFTGCSISPFLAVEVVEGWDKHENSWWNTCFDWEGCQ
jgi:hypothetical protein